MSTRYAVSALDDLATAPIPGQAQWHTIRSKLGISSFGINAWTANEDGQRIIGEHDETERNGHEELYVVLDGAATFTRRRRRGRGAAGDVRARRRPRGEARRDRRAGDDDPRRSARSPARPSPRRAGSGRRRRCGSGRPRSGIARSRCSSGHLAETPDHAGTHYNLACAHARAGRPEVAIDHLVRAVELQASFAEYAATDDDLATLRDDPRFPAAA